MWLGGISWLSHERVRKDGGRRMGEDGWVKKDGGKKDGGKRDGRRRDGK